MGKPKIRFEGYTDDWEQRKLGELAEIKDSARIPNAEWSETGVPYIRASDITNENTQGVLFISPERYEYYKNKTGAPMQGDVLFNGGGEIGKSLLNADNKPIYVQGGAVLYARTSVSKTLDGQYLKTYFETARAKDYIEAVSAGGTMKHFTLKPSQEMSVLYPQISEQRQIGTYFRYLDHLITLHQRKCEETKTLKKYMLQKMFPKNGQSVPDIRFSGFTGDWEQRKLGDLAELIGGGTPSTSVEDYWDGDIDWYAPAEIGEQIYMTSSQRKITEDGLNNSSAKILPVGTVLFTSRAGIGKTAILAQEGCTNQGFQSIVPHHDKLDSYFIFSRSEEMKRYAETVGAGSTFVEVSGKQMANMDMMMPKTMKEQQVIGRYFETIDHLITLHQRKCEELQNIKKFMLQNMFV